MWPVSTFEKRKKGKTFFVSTFLDCYNCYSSIKKSLKKVDTSSKKSLEKVDTLSKKSLEKVDTLSKKSLEKVLVLGAKALRIAYFKSISIQIKGNYFFVSSILSSSFQKKAQ